MNIKIEGTVTINTEETTAVVTPATTTPATLVTLATPHEDIKLTEATTFREMVTILCSSDEVAVSAQAEAEDKADEEKEAALRKAYGDDYDLIVGKAPKKEKRRPGAIKLRETGTCVGRAIIGTNGLCEVFSNGYAIYDNGDRRAVLWVTDCGSTTYYFNPLKANEKTYLSQSDVIGEDVLGDCPWHTPLIIAGENAIEANMEHGKTIGVTSIFDKEEYAVKAAHRWMGGSHIDTPEEAFFKKYAREERLKVLTDKQRTIYSMYFEDGRSMQDIADAMGLKDFTTIREQVNSIKKKLNKDKERFF